MASKGKAIAGKDSVGKRKRGDKDNADVGGQKWKNRNVLQFFEDAAVEFDGHEDSDDASDYFDDDGDFLDDYDAEFKVKSEPGRFEQIPILPKEEELSTDELEKILEERYRSGSGYVRYAEDDHETKRSMDRSFVIPSVLEPMIWKVKCKVGREKHTVFCLMQKYVDVKALGTKLHLISAFAVEHVKGFVFVEAEKQSDVTEACNQLADVYYSLVTQVPRNEVGQLLSVRKRYNEVKEGTWARVKNGIYRGDLAQVVAVNNERKRATVKLIPRVDLQALTEKYGGGAILKRTKNAVPAARLISSSELEEFRPLMQYRRDRDTGKVFEFLDGLMLKDGFCYKKVSIDSLSFWGVNPSEDELQKFTLPSNDESDNLEWLSQLYGEGKKKCNVKIDKGGGKGEGSSGSNEQSSFEVHDLVLFGKRDFGMVIGMEKDEDYKILKNGSEGPVTLTLGLKSLKYVPLDKKFTALDHGMKTISINDSVRILDGPMKERQGIVKQIYRGVIFLYDENDLDNTYFCTKSLMSEKVKHRDSACCGKAEGGPLSFEDGPSSPKSPLSPKKSWQMRENDSAGHLRDKDAMFSIGQSVRIRVGPLKGYLCRVLAVRYSDVTVKLDSQQKIITVKCEHLSEVRRKSSASSIRDDPEMSSPFKSFDLLGAEGSTNEWLQGASGPADGDGWNVGGPSSERNAWPAFPSLGATLQALDDDSKKEDAAWLSKVVAGNEKAAGNSDHVGVWGTSDGGLGKSSGIDASSSWGKSKVSGGDHGGSWKIGGSSLNQGKTDNVCQADPLVEGSKVTNETNIWCNQSAGQDQLDAWNKGRRAEVPGGWCDAGSCGNSGSPGWVKQKAYEKGVTWAEDTESLEQRIGKPRDDAWADAKFTSDPVGDSWSKTAVKLGQKSNTGESSEWKSSGAASESQAGPCTETQIAIGWSQAQGQNASQGWKNNSLEEHPKGTWAKGIVTDVHETWAKAKDLNNKGPEGLSEDPWGKEVEKCTKKDSSSRSKEWRSSSDTSGCDGKGWGKGSGSWTHSQEENTEAGWRDAGGWKSGGDRGQGDSCSKTGAFVADRVSSFGKSGGNDSWGQSKNFENDRGLNRGHGSGWNNGGIDQSGRGRGRGRSDRGQFSSIFKDGQDNYSSWGNSSVENDGRRSTWGKGKSWNKQDDCGGWNKSSEPEKDGVSSFKSSSQIGWNGASSWSACWGQESCGKGYGLAGEGAASDKAMEPQDKATSMDVDSGLFQGKDTEGEHTDYPSKDPWGKAADSRSNKFGVSQGWKNTSVQSQDGGSAEGHGNLGQSTEENAMDGWKKGGTYNSSGWKKGGDGILGKSWDKEYGSEGTGSWSKSTGNDTWESSWNSENDQGLGWGRGSGGRRGRRFHAVRDQSGRGGGGRSAGQGQFSSWKDERQGGSNPSGGNNRSSSWSSGNSGGEDQGWKKPGEGGSSWGGGASGGDNGGSSWSKGWSSHGGGEGQGWKKPGEGGSSWGGHDQSGRGGGGGGGRSAGQGQFSSWKHQGGSNLSNRGSSWSSGNSGGEELGRKKSGEGGSSWGGGASGGDNRGSSWSKGWSSHGGEDQGWKKPGEGGSSWGGGSSNQTSGGNNGGSSWNKDWASGGEVKDKGWSKSRGGGSSWGCGSSDQAGGWDKA